MKKGYLLLLFVYIHLHIQLTMAKHPHHHHAKDCYRCPAGFGVERLCSHLHDTECGACAPDHYSSHRSSWRPCYPCSRCGAGLYVAHECTAERDTVCDSCHTYRGPHNEDFYERCVKPHQSTSAKESEQQSVRSAGLSREVPTAVVVASGVILAALVVVLVAACFVTGRCRTCRRGEIRYPYIAVSTKEAVML